MSYVVSSVNGEPIEIVRKPFVSFARGFLWTLATLSIILFVFSVVGLFVGAFTFSRLLWGVLNAFLVSIAAGIAHSEIK